MANDTFYLDQPLLEDVLKVPHFFNGRLLTQEDLSQEQVAQRARRQHLGRALGSGVAYGLEVVHKASSSQPGDIVLEVAGGLAVAPDGATLHLPDPVPLRLSMRPDAIAETGAAAGDDFGDCTPATSTVSVGNLGLHLLAIRSASGTQGLAAVSGLGNEAAPCNTKYRTHGVSFRTLALGIDNTDVGPNDERFRNAVALECFGFFNDKLVAAVSNPFNVASLAYGKIDALRASGQLSACEVPLAVVHLNARRILDFVDMWPVRRPLLRPPFSPRWWAVGGSDERRRAEGEAGMLCFQDHLSAISSRPELDKVVAKTHFSFLPGGGFLPVGSNGFNAATFLGPTATAVHGEDFGRLRWLVEESWRCDAIDLSAEPLPQIAYFVFNEAADKWVFFLRHSADIVIPPDGGEGPEDPVETEPAKKGRILVVVPRAWMKENGEPRTSLSGVTKGVKFLEIESERAQKILGKRFEVVGKAYTGARFFLAEGLVPGTYRMGVTGDNLLRRFSRVVIVGPGSVLAVLVE